MLFNSYIYILAFLPATFAVYFFLNARKLTVAAKAWLLFASLFFYSWWNVKYLVLILASVLVNFTIGNLISMESGEDVRKKYLFYAGVAANLFFLGYFKYADFFISNINAASGANFQLLNIALPLAISFFTLQQISFLADCHAGKVVRSDLLNYGLFVTFFPQLIAGPIVLHRETMPQFMDASRNRIDYANISNGLYLFARGLFKKVLIADTFATWATNGFDVLATLSFADAWVTALSYTFQIYFDFSGYTDMAIGAALLFNIKLPINFDAPYRARNIQEFWRRWHISLSRFFRDMLYIPLGGNRNGYSRMLLNLMITFVVCGLWHGAAWTFVFWGFLHGAAIVAHRLSSRIDVRAPAFINWFITFCFVNVSWVFFRAVNWSDALKVLKGMAGCGGALTETAHRLMCLDSSFGGWKIIAAVFLAACVWLKFEKSSHDIMEKFRSTAMNLAFAVVALTLSILSLSRVSEFLYFNF